MEDFFLERCGVLRTDEGLAVVFRRRRLPGTVAPAVVLL